MDLSPLIHAVERIAPTLAGAIAGPAGSIVVQAIESTLGMTDATPAGMAKVIDMSDEARKNILALQYAHEQALESLAVSDRQNARDKEVAYLNAGKREWFVPLIALIITVGFFTVIWLIACCKQETFDHDVLNVLCGVLGTAWCQVVSYYFGASNQKMEFRK